MSTALPRLSLPSRKDLYIALTAPAIAYLTTQLIRNLLATTTGTPPRPHIHHAPPTRLLTAHEEATVPYPPDALPGGRNVATPYGRIRAYEWGPARGRKVLFVHGISTPCIALARLAKQLVRRGCRVLLFDLPGRGYSDCVDPAVYRQDAALFSSLMLAVVATSPFNWTDGFSLVGYSLGGGIAADFCSWYPDLVESLVLIAPGGLVRPTRLSVSSKILYSGVLPDWMVNYFVGKRLRPQRPSKLATSAVNRRSSLSSKSSEKFPRPRSRTTTNLTPPPTQARSRKNSPKISTRTPRDKTASPPSSTTARACRPPPPSPGKSTSTRASSRPSSPASSTRPSTTASTAGD
jgi:pimeloyl-ACP methyl ester carboxylesterase